MSKSKTLESDKLLLEVNKKKISKNDVIESKDIISEKKKVIKLKKKIIEKDDKLHSTFTLPDINIQNLDRLYVISEITNKQKREIKERLDHKKLIQNNNHLIDNYEIKPVSAELDTTLNIIKLENNPRPLLGRNFLNNENISQPNNVTPSFKGSNFSEIKEKSEDDVKCITTSLEKLGISTIKKEPIETILLGDHYNIKLYVNNGNKRYELNPHQKLKCSWCHQYPQEGTLMLAVPYKFVPSYIEEHVYAPECVNIVENMQVSLATQISNNEEENKKKDLKSAPKINYFKRDLTSKEKFQNKQKQSIIINDYFETMDLVCNFSCMQSRGIELAIKDPKFKNVKMLITHMYWCIFGKLPEKIISAPHFRTLLEYGGDYTVEEYRKNFKFVELNETNQYYIKAKNIINCSTELFSYSTTN
jgi:hypothetical protein